MFFAMQLSGFTPGAKLDIVHGSFRGIGFGGTGSLVKIDPDHMELALRVTKLLFHIEVKLRFQPNGDGTADFYGGRPDGKKTGNEPAHVKHTMTVKELTPQGTTFVFTMIENDLPVTKTLRVEKAQHKGADAMRFIYDRYELTLAPKR